MAGIKRSTLPVFRLGKTATDPVCTITDSGQVRFNVLAMKAFGDLRKLFIDFDGKTRELKMIATPKPPKDWTEADLFDLKESKGGGGYVSCSAIFMSKDVGILYDNKASGNQHFKPTVDLEKHRVGITIPKGRLEPLPKQARKPRTEKAKAASASGGGDEEIALD